MRAQDKQNRDPHVKMLLHSATSGQKLPQTFHLKLLNRKDCLCVFRQEVGGSGAWRSEAGADREQEGAAEGGFRDQPGVCWEAKGKTHLFQTVAGCLQ